MMINDFFLDYGKIFSSFHKELQWVIEKMHLESQQSSNPFKRHVAIYSNSIPSQISQVLNVIVLIILETCLSIKTRDRK